MPGEKAIIFNPDTGRVQSSDFAPIKAPPDGALCFQDIVDPEKDSAIYQTVSFALGRPGEMVESDCLFRGSKVHLRVIHSVSPEPRRRTSIFIK